MTYSTPGPSRSVMFPADFFDRPAYRRLARKWPLALAWWMRLVLVAREALFKGQLLVGGQPLSLEDLVEVDPAGIDPDFLAALVAEGWLIREGDTLSIRRWSDWCRLPCDGGRKTGPWWDWYSAYLRSPEWAAKRQRVLERDSFLCQYQNCRAIATEVHHLTYERVGEELLEDLLSVCGGCHTCIHGRRS